MNDSVFDVAGKIIVITGGLGQLGKQFALCLLQEGAKVAILDSAIGNKQIDDDLKNHELSEKLLTVQANVTDSASLNESLQVIKEKWHDVPYGLINNAALDSPPGAPEAETGPFEVFPETSWDRIMDVNLKGVFLACQVFGKAMADAGRGSIINIGSTYGIVSPDHRVYAYRQEDGGAPFYKPVAYSASKSALVNFTKYVAVYWADSGVRVNLLVLGGVFNHQDAKFLAEYCSRTPMKRMANEDEYNGTVIYLMSRASSYVTGSTIVVDGGWTAW